MIPLKEHFAPPISEALHATHGALFNLPFPPYTVAAPLTTMRIPLRFRCLPTVLAAFAAPANSSPRGVAAFAAPPARRSIRPTRDAPPARLPASSLDVTRPWHASAAASGAAAVLAGALLLAGPLPPVPAASAALESSAPSTAAAATATAIDVDLRSLPGLTRRVVENRDRLDKDLRDVLEVVSGTKAVSVTPPADVRGAVNAALTRGDARFAVNGEPVSVRVESVPGVVLVRVTSPRLPRLPFLRDGTAALRFADDIVGAAPQQLERAAEEVQVVENFLTWGAPQVAPLQYKGSAADAFFSAPLPAPLDSLNRGEGALLATGTGVLGAYAASYAYYVALQEKAEAAMAEKKAKSDAAKKAKAAAAKKAKAEAAKKAAAEEATAAKKAAAEETTAAATTAVAEKATTPEAPKEGIATETAAETRDDGGREGATPTNEGVGRKRKRNMFKRLFRRGDNR